MSILSHYDGLGVLIRGGLLSPDLVYEINYNSIITFWSKFSGLIGDPILFKTFNCYVDLKSFKRKLELEKIHKITVLEFG